MMILGVQLNTCYKYYQAISQRTSFNASLVLWITKLKFNFVRIHLHDFHTFKDRTLWLSLEPVKPNIGLVLPQSTLLHLIDKLLSKVMSVIEFHIKVPSAYPFKFLFERRFPEFGPDPRFITN